MEEQRPKAAIYCRISDDPEGRALGVQRQEEDCRELAARLGFDIADVYRDNDTSASTLSRKRRAQYDRMIADAEAGNFGVILAYSVDRLTRRMGELVPFNDWCAKRGIWFITVDGDDNRTSNGEMVINIKGSVGQQEARRISERVARASRQRAEAGEWHGGHIPHGYRIEDGRLVEDPATAPLMREAARRLLQGESLYAIANDLNKRGLLTSKGSHWRSQTIRKAMLSPSIVGKREHGGVLYDGQWDGLIAEKAWLQLRELLTDTSRKFGPMDGSYAGKRALGGGLTVCAECGKPLVSQGAARLVCHKQATGGCGGVTITYEPFEEWVLEMVMARLDGHAWRAESARTATKADTRADRLRTERKMLQEERQRVVRSYDLGVRAEDEMIRRVREIDAEVADLERRLGDLASNTILTGVETAGDARRLWDGADVVKRRRFLASLIESVHVSKWPEGMPTKLTRRTSERMAARHGWALESEDDFAKRQDQHRREALRQRVCIKWRQ